MSLMPIYDQQALALHLLRSGSAMFLGGLIIGLAVYGSKYPRITLYAHIEATSYGGSMLVVALIISQTQFIGNLNSWELFAIWLGQIVAWPMWLSQVAQSFWGTNQMNKMVNTCLRV
jgi:ABC-type transport system involved in multi-copper enzyme maturation permease subunit